LALLAGFDGYHALPLEGFWLFVSAHLTSPLSPTGRRES
jgi:hypothetical protein